MNSMDLVVGKPVLYLWTKRDLSQLIQLQRLVRYCPFANFTMQMHRLVCAVNKSGFFLNKKVHIIKLVSKDNTHPKILIQDLNKYLKFKVCI